MLEITIALVTRNRPASLERAIQSIRCQDIQPAAIIVSDDSSSDFSEATREICEKYGCDYLSGSRRGLYANRNLVARACKTSHFRTMDDDHEWPKGHMRVCVEAIQNCPETIWIIGEYNDALPIPIGWTAPCPGELHPRGFSVEPIDANRCSAIACGATIYPRSVVDRHLFNVEDFVFGPAYLEYGCRLRAAGYQISHLKNTYIIHHLEEVGRSFLNDVNYEAASLFAMLSLVSYYETHATARLKFLGELIKRFSLRPRYTTIAFRKAIVAWGRNRKGFK